MKTETSWTWSQQTVTSQRFSYSTRNKIDSTWRLKKMTTLITLICVSVMWWNEYNASWWKMNKRRAVSFLGFCLGLMVLNGVFSWIVRKLYNFLGNGVVFKTIFFPLLCFERYVFLFPFTVLIAEVSRGDNIYTLGTTISLVGMTQWVCWEDTKVLGLVDPVAWAVALMVFVKLLINPFLAMAESDKIMFTAIGIGFVMINPKIRWLLGW